MLRKNLGLARLLDEGYDMAEWVRCDQLGERPEIKSETESGCFDCSPAPRLCMHERLETERLRMSSRTIDFEKAELMSP